MKNHDFEVKGPVATSPGSYYIHGTFLGKAYHLWDDGTLNKELGSYTDLSFRGWFQTRSEAERVLSEAEEAGTLVSVGEDALQKHAKGVCRKVKRYTSKDGERFIEILKELLQGN